jgi:chromate transporter
MNPTLILGAGDVFSLFLHCLSVSLLAVGGGITLLPDFHRFLVAEKGWLVDAQFTSSVALAQAAPGPNVLYLAVLGWNAGFNGGGYAMALACALAAMLGLLIPSSTFTLVITRWAHRNRELRGLRAFKQGMAPLVVGLLIATVWVLGSVNDDLARDWRLWMLSALTAALLWKTRIHLLWLLGAGAGLGALGWV